MPERPIIPPPLLPVREFSTPSLGDGFYTERVDFTDPSYRPIDRGAKYADQLSADRGIIQQFPNLVFLKETRDARAYPWAIRIWATDRLSEDTYNSAVQYVSDHVDFPAYSRVYMVRRDEYDVAPSSTIGQPLDALVGVQILESGSGYTKADFQLDPQNGVAIDVIIDKANGGQIIAAVITNQGSGFTAAPPITIVGDGGGAEAIGIIQPQSAVLVQQKKSELSDDHPLRNEYVLVTRVYETLPGPFITTTRVDDDGVKITVQRRHNRQSTIDAIDPREYIDAGVWFRISSEPVNESYFVGWEVQESRPVPGNVIETTRVDDDGFVVTINKTLKDLTTIASYESLIAGVWQRTHQEPVSDIVAYEINETRLIPGNPVVSTRVDDDGVAVSISKTLKGISDSITNETLGSGVWAKHSIEPITELVVKQVSETRAIPGNPVESTRLDEDGVAVTIVKTLKEFSTIVTQEQIVGSVWGKTTSESITDLVAKEVVEFRAIPGNPVVSFRLDKYGNPVQVAKTLKDTSTIVDQEDVVTIGPDRVWTRTFKEAVTDLVANEVVEAQVLPGLGVVSQNVNGEHEIVTSVKALVEESTITPSATELAGVIGTVEGNEVSNLVSEKVVTQYNWLDKAEYTVSIPDVIPEVFRAQLQQDTISHVVAGTASLPTLGTGEFERTERQLTKLLKEVRYTVLASLGSLPIVVTNTATTTRFGGGDIDIILTLDTHGALTLDEGTTVLSSKIDNLGNGLDVKTTEQLHSGTWPVVNSTHVDPTYGLVIPIAKQVVAAGATGGVVAGVYTEIQSRDKWRSVSIASHLDVSSLPADVQWFSGQRHSFPPELTDAIIDWAEAVCGCSDSFSAILVANMKQYTGSVKTRITEQFYNGPPPDDVVVTQFFPEAHHFGFAWASACGDSDGTCRTKSGAPEFHILPCLHDDLTLTIGPFIVFSFPATSPAALPHGSYIMLPPQVERWRFGVFRRILTEVLVP